MTYTDPSDVGNGQCERCPSLHAVNWAPLAEEWLCIQCLYVATEHELGATVPRWIPIQPLEEPDPNRRTP
jgi:hypothetical protein